MPLAPVPLLNARLSFALAAVLLAAGPALAADPAPSSPADIATVQADADKGVPAAMTALGSIYASGQGVPRDYAKALQYYGQAAAVHDPLAQYNLGLMYESGNGVPADPAKAFGYYLLAAKQGVPQAQFNVGNMYTSGQGVAVDLFEGVLWYRQAAVKGLPEAQFNLGRAYELGQGVSRDLDQAKSWYRSADALGFAKAHARLAELAQAAPVAAAPLPAAPGSSDDRVVTLQAELFAVRADNARALEAMRADKAALELRLQVAEGAMKDALSGPAASGLQDRVRILQADNAELNGEVKASIIQLSKVNGQLDAAQQALAKQNAAGSAAPVAAPAAPAAPDTRATDAKIAELTQELAAARATAEALAGDKAKLAAQVAAAAVAAAARPAPAPASAPVDDGLVRQLRQDVTQHQQDLAAAQHEAEQLRTELKAASEHFDAQAKLLADQVDENRRAQAAAAAGTGQAAADAAALQQLRQEAAQRQQDLASAQHAAEQLRADLKAAADRLDAQEKQLAAAKNEGAASAASAGQALAAKLAAQVDAAGKVIADLNAQNNTLQRTIDAMKAASLVPPPELKAPATGPVAVSQVALQTMEEQVRAATVQRDEDRKGFEGRLTALQAALKGSQDANRALAAANQALLAEKTAEDQAQKSELAALAAQVQELTASRDKSSKDNLTLASMVGPLQQAMEKANSDLATLRTRLAAAEKAAADQADAVKTLTADNQKLTEEKHDVAAQNSKSTMELVDVRNRLASEQQAASVQVASVRTLTAENQRLQGQVQDLARVQKEETALAARLRLAQTALEQISVAARALNETQPAPAGP